MRKKKYFISYMCRDKNGNQFYGNGIRKTRKMTMEQLLIFSKEISEEYDYKNLVVLNFQKIS